MAEFQKPSDHISSDFLLPKGGRARPRSSSLGRAEIRISTLAIALQPPGAPSSSALRVCVSYARGLGSSAEFLDARNADRVGKAGAGRTYQVHVHSFAVVSPPGGSQNRNAPEHGNLEMNCTSLRGAKRER